MIRFRHIATSSITLAASAGLAGAVWGLALARVLAESFPASPTFYLWPSLLVALVPAVMAVGLRRWLSLSTLAPLLLALVYLFWPDVAPRVGWTLLGGSLALAALLAVGQDGILRRAQDDTLPYFLVCATLALYLRTLGPTVGQADTFEFQVVAPTLGIAHPTGYPLYILSGKLFSLLPFGSVAWRVNLTSAVFATAAVLFLYALIRRLIQPAQRASRLTNQLPTQQAHKPMIALIAALAFAFSRVFWSQAVVAEVYALHNLLVAVVLLLLVDLTTVHAPAAPQSGLSWRGLWSALSRGKRLLYALALVLGLSFANHLTTALLLPAVGLALLLVRPRLGWRGWLALAGLFLLGLSLYLYIFFRWPMLHDGVWMSPGEFWRYITGQQFGGALRLDAWRTDPTRYQIVGRLLREPFGWPGLALGAVGLSWLAIKRWRVALITLVTFLAYAWYALSYYVPDVSLFLLPAHLVLALWLGVGSVTLIEIVMGRRGRDRHPTALSISISISCLYLLPLALLWTNLPLVDQSGERAAYVWGKRVLDLPLAPDAAILADSARIAPLYYLQRIEGRRPDLDMLVLADEATYRAELEVRVAAGQSVYLARFLPGLEGRYHLRSLGPLTEVATAPLAEPPPLDRVLSARFDLPDAQGGSIELLGLTGPVPGPDGGVGLTLYWRAEGPISEVYHVRLRLVDGAGQVWWQDPDGGRHAANNYYPTPAWRPGEVVVDYHEIPPLAPDPTMPAGGFMVQVGLFRPFSDEGLTTQEGEMWYPLMPLDPPAPAGDLVPPHPLRARFGPGGLTLTGVDLPDVVAAGAAVKLTLHWRAGGGLDQTRPTLTWVDRQGSGVVTGPLERLGYSRFSLHAPTSPGTYGLRLGLVGPDGRPLMARCGWLARPSDGCVLATVHVAEVAASALANFDGEMLLLDVEIGTLSLRPGSSLPLTLGWQGLRPMADDYTVSVQLIGPDGRLYGQADAWPVQGTLPTSQWSPGQHIADPYQVTLRPDAPPGRYRVGIVVYLLATQTRLPLLDRSGRVIGDIAWVGELEVSQDSEQ